MHPWRNNKQCNSVDHSNKTNAFVIDGLLLVNEDYLIVWLCWSHHTFDLGWSKKHQVNVILNAPLQLGESTVSQLTLAHWLHWLQLARAYPYKCPSWIRLNIGSESRRHLLGPPGYVIIILASDHTRLTFSIRLRASI